MIKSMGLSSTTSNAIKQKKEEKKTTIINWNNLISNFESFSLCGEEIDVSHSTQSIDNGHNTPQQFFLFSDQREEREK